MSQPMNPYDPIDPPRQGMSGTNKVLLTFGIGCGVVLLLCCGVFGVGGFFMYQFVQNSTVTEPDKIRAITEEIVVIAVPDTLVPTVGIDAHVPITGKELGKGAIYANEAKNSQLILGQFNEEFAKGTDMELQMRRSMQESGQGQHEQLKTLETEDFESTINNQPAKFKITKGLNEQTKDEFWDVIGTFSGKGGPAMLILRFKSPEFDKEQVLGVLKSMH